MRVIEKTVYKFSELDDSGKEKAREWYRSSIEFSDLDHVMDDVTQAGAMLGIEFQTRDVHLMNGSYKKEACIYWSGFWSQGDWLSFEGWYSYKKGALQAIAAEWPQEKDLHDIAKALQDLQKPYFYSLSGTISRIGNYYHAYTMQAEAESERRNVARADENALLDLMRDFAFWAYRYLESEYNYQNSDISVEENIILNDYEFNSNGSIYTGD